jgi:hypothetical protein
LCKHELVIEHREQDGTVLIQPSLQSHVTDTLEVKKIHTLQAAANMFSELY